MSLIAHSFMPRSMFDMDEWFRPQRLGIGPSTLDLFDPFDELDRVLGRNLMWLTKPSFLDEFIPVAPRVPNKYRVTLNVAGFNPNSIKTEVTDANKLVITGQEGNKHDSEDFSVREFRKSYQLPANAEKDKLASFVTANGTLVVEVPLKESERRARSINNKFDVVPRIVDAADGKKNVAMNISLPEHVDPSKISVTCKDRDLIVKAEEKSETSDGVSSVYYYTRTTLPENTDFNSLKCTYENNCLSLCAPLVADFKANQRSIPIEFAKQQQQQQQVTNGQN